MENPETCSYKDCSQRPWRPDDEINSGHESYCIFHSPFAEKKKKAFKEAWEKFYANLFFDSQKVTSLICTGFIFPIQIQLKNLSIIGKSDFSHTIFQKTASFDKTRFTRANFTGARFEGDASFNKTSFSSHCSFESSEFLGKASFSKSEFLVPLFFRNAHFSCPVNFKKAHFSSISFDHSTFLDTVDFNSARFLQVADFRNVCFSGNAHFTNVHFKNKAIFDDARFSRFGFFSNINLSSSSISFTKQSRSLVNNPVKKTKHPFHFSNSLFKTWNAIHKWHLKYKSSTV